METKQRSEEELAAIDESDDFEGIPSPWVGAYDSEPWVDPSASTDGSGC